MTMAPDTHGADAARSTPERLRALLNAMRVQKKWHESWTALRLAALSLVSVEGAPSEVVREFRDHADRLYKDTSAFHPLRSMLRFGVAAWLMRDNSTPADFLRTLPTIQAQFRGDGLRKGHGNELLAALVLCRADQVEDRCRRFAELSTRLDKGRLLGFHQLYPARAFLVAVRDEPVEELEHRVRAASRALETRGVRGKGWIESVAHMYALLDTPAPELARSGTALYRAFADRGLRMNRGDQLECGLLAPLGTHAGEIAHGVLEHRAEIDKLHPKPGREESFRLACGTWLRSQTRGEHTTAAADVELLARLQAFVELQQSAAIVACM